MKEQRVLDAIETIKIVKSCKSVNDLLEAGLVCFNQKKLFSNFEGCILIKTEEGFVSVFYYYDDDLFVKEQLQMHSIQQYHSASLQHILNEKEKELEALEKMFNAKREVLEMAPVSIKSVKRRLKVDSSNFRVVNVFSKKEGKIVDSLLMLNDYSDTAIKNGFGDSIKKVVMHDVELTNENIVDYLPFDFVIMKNVTVEVL